MFNMKELLIEELCDKKSLLSLTNRFFKTVVGPTMIYGTDYWAIDRKTE